MIEANLVKLNEIYRLPQILELVERKLTGPEKSILTEDDFSFHSKEYERLRGQLADVYEKSKLPENASAKPRLHDLLLRLRLPKIG